MRRRRGEHGQAVVEFTLLFPVVLFLILVISELGVAVYTAITVTSAAREAARFAAVANLVGDTCQAGTVTAKAVSTSGNRVVCDEVTVWFVDLSDPPDALATRGDAVVVTIDHEYSLITPLGALASAFSFGTIPDSFTISACADARLEGTTMEPDPATFPGFLAQDCGS